MADWPTVGVNKALHLPEPSNLPADSGASSAQARAIPSWDDWGNSTAGQYIPWLVDWGAAAPERPPCGVAWIVIALLV